MLNDISGVINIDKQLNLHIKERRTLIHKKYL